MKRIKNILYSLSLFLLMLTVLVNCNSEPEYYTLETPEDQMNISAETDNILLDLAKAKQEAIKFTWGNGSNRGADTEINYCIKLYNADNEGNATELVNLGADSRSFSYTHSELNAILNSWGVFPGNETTVVAEVIAKVVESKVYMKPEVSRFEFKVTGYDSNVYLFYVSGASVLRAKMEIDPTEDGVYTWEGKLPACTYWFSTNNSTGNPGYMKGVNSNSLIYQEIEGGVPFETESGFYDVKINLEEMTTSIKQMEVVADMLDVQFNLDGTATDKSAMNLPITKISYNYPFVVSNNTNYSLNMATFSPASNGGSPGVNNGSYYRIDYLNNTSFESKLADGHSLECLVQFDVDYTSGGQNYETKYFSSQSAGGTGLTLSDLASGNGISFMTNVPTTNGGGSNWIRTNSKVTPDGKSWYHIVGVWDKDAGKSYIYVNGVKIVEVSATGYYRPTSSTATRWFAIGGNAGDNQCSNMFKGSVAIARIYDAPLTSLQVECLWNKVNQNK